MSATPGLTRTVLDRLGKGIVVGDFDSAGFPTEAQLSDRLGISRSVAREAVRMLTAKGMLTARPRIGTTILPSGRWNLFDPDVLRWLLERPFSIDLLRQFNELRLGIEPEAAGLAAHHATPAQLGAIAAGLDRMRSAEAGEHSVLDSDIAFHSAILNASGNPFYDQLRALVVAALRSSIQLTNRIKGRSADIDEHARVYAAIANGDRDGARAAMRKLIADVLDLIDLHSAEGKRAQ